MPVLCVRCGYTVERTPEMYCPRCGAMLYYQENEVAYTGNTEPAVRKESTTIPVVHEESIAGGNYGWKITWKY